MASISETGGCEKFGHITQMKIHSQI